jgi:putative hemolysin
MVRQNSPSEVTLFSSVAFEILIVFLLILANGWLARSELSVVSSKRVRLQRMAKDGNEGAKRALHLLENPSGFLASVQIGITLIGILAGAFGGATISREIDQAIRAHIPSLAIYAEGLSVGIVVVVISFFSLIFGELVPKRLAIAAPEQQAASSSAVLMGIAWISRPVVKFLSAVTDATLKIIGYSKPKDVPITEDEVEILVDQGTETGVFGQAESSIIKRAMRLGDLRVSHLMTPRTRLLSLDLSDSLQSNLDKISASNHTYYPVVRGDWCHLVGVVSGKRMLRSFLAGEEANLENAIVTPLFLPETTAADAAMEKFRDVGLHVAIVVDEYDAVAGMLTLNDTVEALVGGFPQIGEETRVVTREDGSLLVDGLMPLPEFAKQVNLVGSTFDSADFQTLGGLVMGLIGALPREGNVVEYRGFRFEVVDMDGHRIDKVLVSQTAKDSDTAETNLSDLP